MEKLGAAKNAQDHRYPWSNQFKFPPAEFRMQNLTRKNKKLLIIFQICLYKEGAIGFISKTLLYQRLAKFKTRIKLIVDGRWLRVGIGGRGLGGRRVKSRE